MSNSIYNGGHAYNPSSHLGRKLLKMDTVFECLLLVANYFHPSCASYKRNKQLSLIIVVLLFSFHSFLGYGQYNTNQNKNWVFANHVGISFLSGSPVPFVSSINTFEGCATLSDASGNLLFYTDGVSVWNSTGALMPGGTAIVGYGTGSTTQAAVIAPVFGSSSQYYVFSLEHVSSISGSCRLSRTLIDMSLAGGLGDVVPGSVGIPMEDSLGEKMCLIQGNNCNIWLVVHRRYSLKFLAYEINSSGVSTTPVVSNTGALTGNFYRTALGVIKASHDRTKVVAQIRSVGPPIGCGTELFDFNPNTGVLSNNQVLDSGSSQYGAEFSPSNSKLYCFQTSGISGVYQYDITGSSTAAISATRTFIASGGAEADMRLASDGKIYLKSGSGFGSLDCINSPDLPGALCSYSTSVVTLASGTSAVWGLSQLYVDYRTADTNYNSHDTTACIPAGGSISITGHGTGTSYVWYDGATTSTHTVSAYGTYWVGILNGCTVTFDTIHVLPAPPTSAIYKHDTSLCESVVPYLLAANSGFTHYIWNDSSTSATLTVTTTGTYWVRAYDGCDNEIIDTFHVRFIEIDSSHFTFDFSLCQGTDGITLNASPGLDAYAWQDGTTTGTVYTATSDGTYFVVGTSFCKVIIDSFYVSPKELTFSLGNDTTICVAYQLVSPLIDPTYTYLWQDGDTGPTNFIAHSGNYILTIKFGYCTSSDTINVQFDHIEQNIRDTFICKEEPINVVVNATLFPGGSVLWNDGSTNPTKVLRDSGIYWVFVSKKECMILDTIRVSTGYCDCWHDLPQAFTPNNDGLNDVIKPIIQPGCTVSGYQFNIYNRWGELVFSSDVPGIGWDGKYKSQPADLGVYMYFLQFSIGVHDKPVYNKGSITLIR